MKICSYSFDSIREGLKGPFHRKIKQSLFFQCIPSIVISSFMARREFPINFFIERMCCESPWSMQVRELLDEAH